MALELLSHLKGRVGVLEPGHAGILGGGAFRRERQCLLRVVGPVGEVAIGDVEAGRQLGQESRDGRLERVSRERGEDLVVGCRRVLLEPLRVEQQLRRRVVVLLEDRVDLLEEGLHGHGLRLRRRRRSTVGLGSRVRRAALFVEAPVAGEVAVRVDPVAGSDHAVAVVVAQVLAPQPVAGGERELVAVGVVHAHEPELGRVDETGDLETGAGALPVVAGEVVEGAPAGFAREPLAGVLHGVVEDRGAPRDVRPGGALGDLEGDDLAAAVGGAGDALLRDRGVVGQDPVVRLGVLLLVVVGHGVVLRPDRPLCVAGAVGGRRLRAGRPGRSGAVRRQLSDVELGEVVGVADHVDGAAFEVAALRDVVPGEGECAEVLRSGLHPEGVEGVGDSGPSRVRWAGSGRRQERGHEGDSGDDDKQTITTHRSLPSEISRSHGRDGLGRSIGLSRDPRYAPDDRIGLAGSRVTTSDNHVSGVGGPL